MFLLSGSMHLSLEVLLTVGADEEVSLTETEWIRLLADYIQETERFFHSRVLNINFQYIKQKQHLVNKWITS
jgi:serine protease inhibitor